MRYVLGGERQTMKFDLVVDQCSPEIPYPVEEKSSCYPFLRNLTRMGTPSKPCCSRRRLVMKRT